MRGLARADVDGDVAEADLAQPGRELRPHEEVHVAAEREPVVALAEPLPDDLERMAGMAGDAVEERPGAEPAAVEVVAADGVPDPREELFEAAPASGALGDDREEAAIARRERERGQLAEIAAPGLMAAEGGPFREKPGGLFQELPAERTSRFEPDQDVAPFERGAQDPGIGIPELRRIGTEPGLEKPLVEDEPGQAELLGDVGLVLGDGLRDVRLADEEEIAVLMPAPGARLPEVGIAAEPPFPDDGSGGRSRTGQAHEAVQPVLPGRAGRAGGESRREKDPDPPYPPVFSHR